MVKMLEMRTGRCVMCVFIHIIERISMKYSFNALNKNDAATTQLNKTETIFACSVLYIRSRKCCVTKTNVIESVPKRLRKP